jgi:ubiquinone/menaquinone biosynthesis C-methylase UbiE
MIRDETEITHSAIEARNTVLPAFPVQRYLNPPADTVFPLEYAFHLLGDVRAKHVLDLGCGTGEEVVTLARRGAHVVGIDVSPDLIALAQERIHRERVQAELKVGSAYQTELLDGSVDVIFCMSLIHQLNIPMAVAEMRRTLSLVLRQGTTFTFFGWI